MNAASTSAAQAEAREARAAKVTTGGSVVEALVGIGVIVLAILGLKGIRQADLAAIAAIAIGTSFLLEGGSVAASYRQFFAGSAAELGNIMTVEFLGGFAGIILGILALLGITPPTLIAVSVIVFGATLLLSSGGTAQFGSYAAGGTQEEKTWMLAREAASSASSGKLLIGLAAVVLGILAVLGINSLILSLVAFLVLGVSVLLSGTALSSRMMRTAHA